MDVRGIDAEQFKLPALSKEGAKLLGLLVFDDVPLKEVAEIVARDPVLSGLLIKHANSPLCRRGGEITSVRAAVNTLGLKKIQLAVRVAAMRALPRVDSPMMEYIWEHSLGIATLVRLIAGKALLNADDVELTGLMHDLVSLILLTNFPDEYESLVKQAMLHAIPYDYLEKAEFGQLYRRILRWAGENLHLPSVTREALYYFHGYDIPADLDSEPGLHYAVISLAHYLEAALHEYPSEQLLQNIPASIQSVKGALKLCDDELHELLDQYVDLLGAKT